MQRELADQAQGRQVAPERVAPAGQTPLLVEYLDHADAGVVVVVHVQATAQRPFAPAGFVRCAGEQAAVGDDDHAAGELQALVEIEFEPGLGLLAVGQHRVDFGGPMAGEHQFAGGEIFYI